MDQGKIKMELDIIEVEQLKSFLVELFGDKANHWNMSSEIFDLTYELISESSECTDAMRWVPHPHPLGSSPIRWMSKEIRRKFIQALKDNKEHYKTCLSTAAYRMATKFEMASQGI